LDAIQRAGLVLDGPRNNPRITFTFSITDRPDQMWATGFVGPVFAAVRQKLQ
jgi:hypothetical protein